MCESITQRTYSVKLASYDHQTMKHFHFARVENIKFAHFPCASFAVIRVDFTNYFVLFFSFENKKKTNRIHLICVHRVPGECEFRA